MTAGADRVTAGAEVFGVADGGERLFEVVDIGGPWPEVGAIGWRVEVWYEFISRQRGAGIFEDDDPASGRWASAAARRKYDLAQYGVAGRRCPVDLTAFDPRRQGGRLARRCSRACSDLGSRAGWNLRAAWVRCPSCGLGRLAPAALTSRPRPACPPPHGSDGPSPCEAAYARMLGAARTARCRRRSAERTADRAELDDLVDGLSAGFRLPMTRMPAEQSTHTAARPRLEVR